MILYLLLILHVFNILIDLGNAITINILAYTHYDDTQLYESLIKEFNKYSKKTNLNITLNLNLLSTDNVTFNGVEYDAVESLLLKHSEKYDIYFYDVICANRLSNHLIDLKEYLPEDHIKMYSEGVASQTSIVNGRWIGLPFSVEYSVLYRNEELLNKYNKSYPKTWDELIEITKYILDEEKKLNNTNLIGYNGLFPLEKEIGLASIYESIHSCRNSVDSPFPNLNSDESKNAMILMKKIKNEVSSDEIFRSWYQLIRERLSNKKFIFLKYWYMSSVEFPWSILPGIREGLSGTIIGGFNMGIGNYLKRERLMAAVEVVKYITSYDTQKKFIIDRGLISGIPRLYEDEEVCQVINCDIFKSFQPVARPGTKMHDYNSYSARVRHSIFDYLYGDQSIDNALKDINNLSNVYSSASKIKKYSYSINIIILFVFIFLIMI